MSNWDPRRWSLPFAVFVRKFGADELAEALEIEVSAVYHWIRGVTSPTSPRALKIVELATAKGIPLTLEQVLKHAQEVKALPPIAEEVTR